MEIPVKLDSFEGPLDLLLHLIEKNKVNIYDIPINEITEQYLEYMGQMQEEERVRTAEASFSRTAREEERTRTAEASFSRTAREMDTMSDFLVMAATLLDIKARMLLPAQKDEDGEEIDPRAELVRKLLEYKTYKYMSGILREQESEGEKILYRDRQLPEEIRLYREPVDIDELLKNVTLPALHAVFQDVIKRGIDRVDPVRSSFGRIEREEVDAKSVRRSIAGTVRKKKKCTFRSLLTGGKGKMYVVVTFLTILELMKSGKIDARQDDDFGEIYITANENADWETTEQETEWDE